MRKVYKADPLGSLFWISLLSICLYFSIDYGRYKISFIIGCVLAVVIFKLLFSRVRKVIITDTEVQIHKSVINVQRIPHAQIQSLLVAKDDDEESVEAAIDLIKTDMSYDAYDWTQFTTFKIIGTNQEALFTLHKGGFSDIWSIALTLKSEVLEERTRRQELNAKRYTNSSNKAGMQKIEMKSLVTNEDDGSLSDLDKEYFEQLNALINKVHAGMQNDDELVKKLHATLQLTYNSVYKSVSADQELEGLKSAKYHHELAPGKYEYFVEGEYLPNISEANIRVAETLIATSEGNLKVVNNRIASNQILMQELSRMKVRRKANSKALQELSRAANLLEELQHVNTGELAFHQDLENETVLLEELSKLTAEASQADSLEKSLALREHIQLFQEHLA